MNRRIFAAGVGVVLALGLAGCGSSGAKAGSTTPSSGPRVPSSSTTPGTTATGASASKAGPVTGTAEAKLLATLSSPEGTYRFRLVSTASGGPTAASGGAATISETGVYSNTSHLGTFVVSPPSGSGVSSLSGIIDGPNRRLLMKVPASLESRVGKPWVSEQFGSALGANGIGTAVFDPAEALKWVASLATSVTEVGPRDFHGLKTTEYVLRTTWARILHTGGSANASAAGKELSYDVYFDASGRPVGFRISIPLGKLIADAASSLGLSGTATEKLSQVEETLEMDVFGSSGAVKVSIPPASQVKALSSGSSLLGGL